MELAGTSMKRTLLALLVCVYMVGQSGHLTASELRVTLQEEYCLALNDYYEARGESIQGRLAVAFVVLNRVRSPYYPKTLCEVIHQCIDDRCAFSWVSDRYPIREQDSWEASLRLSRAFLHSYRNLKDPTNGSVYYHKHTVVPYWTKGLDYSIRIDDHVFYPTQTAELNK